MCFHWFLSIRTQHKLHIRQSSCKGNRFNIEVVIAKEHVMSAQTICTHTSPLKSISLNNMDSLEVSFFVIIESNHWWCRGSLHSFTSNSVVSIFLKTNLRQNQDELFSWYADLLFCIVILYHQLQKRDLSKKSLNKKLDSFSYYICGLELIKNQQN